jgi:hypothetical protein
VSNRNSTYSLDVPKLMGQMPPPLPDQRGFICETCGICGWPKSFTPGSLAVELVLWILFCFPGVVYTVWRLASRRKVCPSCQGKMIDLQSPRGRALFQQFHRR